MKCSCGRSGCMECGHCECLNTHWISVKEKLPPEMEGSIYSDNILVIDEDNDYFIAVYIPSGKTWNEYYEAPYGNIEEITHWMPLPKSPKIKEEE